MLFYKYVYWCCPHSMWSRVCAGCSSIRPSVCLTHRSKAATAAGGFAAERPACSRPVGRRYRLIAASALQAPCCRRWRSAANAGSVVVLRADEAGSTESSYFDGVPGCPSLRTWTNCIVDCWHLNVMFLNSMRWLTAPISQRWWRLLAVISTRSRPTRFITLLSSDHHNGDNRSHRCCVTLLLRSSCDWRCEDTGRVNISRDASCTAHVPSNSPLHSLWPASNLPTHVGRFEAVTIIGKFQLNIRMN